MIILQLECVLAGALLALMAIGLSGALLLPGTDRFINKYLITLFAFLTLYTITYFIDGFLYGRQSMVLLLRIIWVAESLLLLVPIVMYDFFLLYCSGESPKKNPLLDSVYALTGVFIILLIIGHFTPLFFYATPDGRFVRGPWYTLLITPVLLIMCLNLAAVLRRRKKLPRKYLYALLANLLPMLAASLINIFADEPAVFTFGLILSALPAFGIIVWGQLEQYIRQQREIAHQRASIMILQMRPHFIYNTMTSIYYLCEQDPRTAQKLTLDFTTYLRKNFTAIASIDPIPFTEELEHTCAYLAVEKAQFEESLFITYDTPHTQFRLPPLTLQPIVENAVKHGMDPDSAPLRILIRTRETEEGSEILVENNGAVFELSDSSHPHIALTNIRERLEMMCNGTMTILPREGGGTVVRLYIPNESSH